ncbi:major facilitator superfamily transport protein [Pseudomonas sp. M47T1]|uniref:MFS transporter n=1 Tax=unclassified Pseudomonas TaxID=196821 RepID=UPI0002607232|nr:MFS transporter [Pseudomonas sp. M47T1]EIK97051.1 major facilitator superfamily transport protein [Pseudomonas sp. M47T1]
MKLILFALALAAFAIGTTEFAPMGLLPVIADGVHVSIPTAGLLISAYAIGVMVGAPLMTLLLAPARRKSALLGLMAIFTLGNLFSALAPGYDTLVLSRVFTSLAHGAFFGIGSVVAANLVPADKRAGAVATMFMGLTIANIGGVPAATWLGQAIGWRMAFAATAGLGALSMLGLALWLPRGERGEKPDVRRELRVLMRGDVVRALFTTVLGAGAMFTLYTYIAAVMQHLINATPTFVTVLLVMIGIGFTAGNYLSGKLANRSLEGTLAGFLVLMAVLMFGMPELLKGQVSATVLMVLWGASAFALIPVLQTRVMQSAHDAPGLASSVNIGAFNLGNGLGAALGGGVLTLGLGYEWIAPAGGLLALAGLVLVGYGHFRAPAGVAQSA